MERNDWNFLICLKGLPVRYLKERLDYITKSNVLHPKVRNCWYSRFRNILGKRNYSFKEWGKAWNNPMQGRWDNDSCKIESNEGNSFHSLVWYFNISNVLAWVSLSNGGSAVLNEWTGGSQSVINPTESFNSFKLGFSSFVYFSLFC